MENSSDILTIHEVAKELRCSKAHVANALLGKIKGLPRLTHMPLDAVRSFAASGCRNGSKRTELGKMSACQNASFWTQKR